MKSISELSRDDQRAVALFRALGNPARMLIVRELARQPGCVNGDFVDLLPLAHSTVSQHLKVLRDAGVIRGTIEGEKCYCLDPDAMRWIELFCGALVIDGPDECVPLLAAEGFVETASLVAV